MLYVEINLINWEHFFFWLGCVMLNEKCKKFNFPRLFSKHWLHQASSYSAVPTRRISILMCSLSFVHEQGQGLGSDLLYLSSNLEIQSNFKWMNDVRYKDWRRCIELIKLCVSKNAQSSRKVLSEGVPCTYDVDFASLTVLKREVQKHTHEHAKQQSSAAPRRYRCPNNLGEITRKHRRSLPRSAKH